MRSRGEAAPLRVRSQLPVVALLVACALVSSCTGDSSTPTPPPGSASPGADGIGSGPPPSPPAGPFASVSESDFQFAPAKIVVSTHQGIRIQNAGPSLHNFSVSGSQVDLDTTPGQTTRTEPIGGALEPGTYPFFCKYHRASGMVGVIIVVPD